MSYSAQGRQNQYENEISCMSEREKAVQQRFEQIINLLIVYKQGNPTIEVVLSEKQLEKALKWYNTEFINKLSDLKE
jgi:hypothetical protein